MASIFWDGRCILFIEKGQTINSEYYMTLLEHLNDKINKKRPGLKKKKVFFIKTMHRFTSLIKMTVKMHELGYELRSHPPYSSDLAPSDFVLLADLKKMLAGQT
jgi:[histone H3]-lysine36 N-dimethyltransferase SETMAR